MLPKGFGKNQHSLLSQLVSQQNKIRQSFKGPLVMSVRDAATKYNLTEGHIRKLCTKGRVDGAYKVGCMWLIPPNWKPVRKHRGWPKGKPNPRPYTRRKKDLEK